MTAAPSAPAHEKALLPELIGLSPAMQLARSRLERFATSRLAVVLVGPTGTGKDLLARHLHAQSGRPGRLVDVNCGALPRDMVESLLFGHTKGAFTGAVQTTVGLISGANGGTLFLDELSSLPLEGQAKLLRVLENGEVLPLGASAKHAVDFRLVTAVHEDIHAHITEGRVRQDLYHRVAALRIDLPALDRRKEDIAPLAIHFAHLHGRTLTPAAIGVLQRRSWPGNVRELRAAIDRAALLSDRGTLEAEVVDDAEYEWPTDGRAQALRDLCRAHGGRADAIADALGISRATLFRRLRAFGISLVRLRVSQSLELSHVDDGADNVITPRLPKEGS
jgi:DNA-binding NtrC family response regulator